MQVGMKMILKSVALGLFFCISSQAFAVFDDDASVAAEKIEVSKQGKLLCKQENTAQMETEEVRSARSLIGNRSAGLPKTTNHGVSYEVVILSF